MNQVTTRGPTHSCRALQSRTTQLRSGLLLELRSIALGFFQPAFLALPTWRIHASLLRPLACLAHSSLREANIAHTPFTHTTPARAQTRIVHTQHPIHESEESKPELCARNTQFKNPKLHKHTHRSTQEVVGRSEDSREVGRVGIIKELWMRMGLKTGLNHIRRRHKVCSSSLANTRVLLC
jgi:hypothetical protein